MTSPHAPWKPASAPTTVVVLASGTGSLLRALLEAAAVPGYPAKIIAVGVDRSCAATDHADTVGVPHFLVRLQDYSDRAAWDAALTDAVATYNPDLVVSAGFMKLLGPAFLRRFGGRIINTHPALLPAFPGAHGVRDALSYGVRVTGCTVHLVDAGVDTGPILAQEAVRVLPGDDEDTLHERIKVVERRLLAEVVAAVATRGIVSDGRKAVIPDERVLR
ncbi:phosphoribosylglycinamide formyltransferase [Nocardia sp. 004]|uniref:phosphoribosylglycinamide formyltransferase n=1 Tax=Nocardia sp. 004 TaxID=3385978 RepID=UPI0039A2DD7C